MTFEDCGIADGEIFAVYNGNRISTKYDIDNFTGGCLKEFEFELLEVIKDEDIVTEIIQTVNRIHLGNLYSENKEEAAKEHRLHTETIPVSEAVKLSKGEVHVKGVVTGKSEPFRVITGMDFIKCWNCSAINGGRKYSLPLLAPKGKDTTKCINCEESLDIEYTHEPAVKIRLRDEDVFEEFEANIILYNADALDIGYGEIVVVSGDIHVIQVHGKNGKLIPYIFSKTITSEYKKEIIPTEADAEAFKRWVNLPNKPESYPNLLDRLTGLFALGIVGGKSKKLALLRSMVNAQADKHKRAGSPSSIITTAMVGDPGEAKTEFAKECVRVMPNSRYTGAQNSTGLSLTAHVEVENDVKIVRYGPIPLSRYGVCVINEFDKMSFENQSHVLDVMSEHSFPMTKYGIHKIVPAPTTMIVTMNQFGTKWRDANKISKDEIPILHALVDRVDQLLVFRDVLTKQERLEYAEEKRKVVDRLYNYNFLTKYLIYASTIQPTFTREAEDIINNFWKDMDNMEFGGGKRNLNTIYRLAEAHARLRLSNKVDKDIAEETLNHYKVTLLEQGKIVVATENIKQTAVNLINKIIERTKYAITLEDATNIARIENEKVRDLLGEGKLTSRANWKFRDLCKMFREMKDSHIIELSTNPLTYKWSMQRDACDVSEVENATIQNISSENPKTVLEDSDRTLEKIKVHIDTEPHTHHTHHIETQQPHNISYSLLLSNRNGILLSRLQSSILKERKEKNECIVCGEILLTDLFYRKNHRCEPVRYPKVK